MPTIIDSLIVKLGLDKKDYDAGSEKVKKSLKETGTEAEKAGAGIKKHIGKEGASSFDSIAKSAVKFLAVIGGTYAIKQFIEQTIESNAALDRFSKNLGVAVESVSAWSQATQFAGGSAADLQGAIAMLSMEQTKLKLTGESSLRPFLNYLGVAIAEGGKARPVLDMFLDMSDKFTKMPNRTDAYNTGLMMGIPAGMMNLLLTGRQELEKIVTLQKKYAVTEKEAAQSTKLREHITELKFQFEAFGRKLMDDATPALEWLLTKFEKFGDWALKNTNTIKVFLGVVAGGLALITFSVAPITLLIGGIILLGIAISLLYKDYEVWKKGGDSLINWKNWEGEINEAKKGIKSLGEVLRLTRQEIGFLAQAWDLFKAGKYSEAWEAVKKANEIDAQVWDKLGTFGPGETIRKSKDKIKGEIFEAGKWISTPSARKPSYGVAGSAFGNLVSRGEGTYNSVNRGRRGFYRSGTENLENMTVAEVMAAQKQGRFNAAGRYQIIASTLASAVKELGLTGSEKFDRSTQDMIFEKYLAGSKRPALRDYLSGKSNDLHAAVKAASEEWASLADPDTGKSHYAGVANNRASISSDEVANALKLARQARKRPLPPIPNASEFATGAGAGQSAQDKATAQAPIPGPQSSNSIQTHIGEINVHTQATDAEGIAKDMGKSMDYLFSSQANYGLI